MIRVYLSKQPEVELKPIVSVSAFLFMFVLASDVFAENYKWVDSSGKTHFTDNARNVPVNRVKEARFEFDSLPPVQEQPIVTIHPTENYETHTEDELGIEEKTTIDPAMILVFKNVIEFFEEDSGRYNVMINQWPPSIAKWRVMRKAVLKTTASKEALLHALPKLDDSTALKIVEAYLNESIKNDQITSKWNNYGNQFTETEGEDIDPDTGELEIIITKKPSGNGMTAKLSRRLRTEEAQKKLILLALKTELQALTKL